MRKEKTAQLSYLEKLVPPETEEMQIARQSSVELGLDGISLSAAEAYLVQSLAKPNKPLKAVEIGTLTGLSALYWLQMMGPTGVLWSFEKSPEHLARAEKNLKKYIDQKRCHLILGDAAMMLPTINVKGPFDFIFIDGNKSAYLEYWNWAEKNIAANGMIVVDNVFLGGSIYDPAASQRFSEKQIGVVQKMNASAYENRNFTTTIIPTSEGLLIARRN